MRNVIIIGLAIGVSVALPMAYEKSPETFHRLIAAAPAPGAHPAPKANSVVPTVAPSTLALASGRKVRLTADAAGHFRTDLKFNGRRVTGMVDTGASLVAINNSTARRIGIVVPAAEFKHEVNTANGTTRAALVQLDAVEIGRIRVENVAAVVLDDRALSTTLIGMSLLKELARFEVADGVLILEQ